MWRPSRSRDQPRRHRCHRSPAAAAPPRGAACREWPADATRYQLLGVAGRGAHAVVYRARCLDFSDGPEVAIKRLDLDASCDLAAVTREATLLKRFRHPAVLPLHAAFVTGKELWLVTPLMVSRCQPGAAAALSGPRPDGASCTAAVLRPRARAWARCAAS